MGPLTGLIGLTLVYSARQNVGTRPTVNHPPGTDWQLSTVTVKGNSRGLQTYLFLLVFYVIASSMFSEFRIDSR